MALTKAEFRTAVREVLYDPDGSFGPIQTLIEGLSWSLTHYMGRCWMWLPTLTVNISNFKL